MAKKAASFFGFLIAGLSCTTALADASLIRSGPFAGTLSFVVTGEITERDAAFFASHSTEFVYKNPTIFLNSRGGDVDAAMKIGRIIRSADAQTWIQSKGRCYSSCALIFIAGVLRWNLGELGLHRPYLASAPLSRVQIEKQLPIMRSAVKTYVQEMGITETFFERMFNTDPSEIEIYRDDWEKIVPGTDPTYDEVITSTNAKRYGLTTSEYRKRNLLARSCYPKVLDGPKYPDCHESIMWGLSPDEYRSRWTKAKAVCGDDFSESEKQLLNATPTKDRNTLPLVTQHFACQVNTMSGK